MKFIKNFIRKNIMLLIPAGLVLVAVLLGLLVFTGKRGLAKMMQQSVSLADRIDSISRNPVSMQQWQVEQEIQDKAAQDANKVAELAAQTTQRELLSYKIFPKPQETSRQIFSDFGENALKAFKELPKKMQSGEAPTSREIEFATGSKSTARDAFRYGGTDQTDNTEAIINELCKQKALGIKCYARTDNFVGYEIWLDWQYAGVDAAVQDCWYTQLAWWIQQDLADTIIKINSKAKNVLESPVKRLLGVSFESTIIMATAPESTAREQQAKVQMPVYVTSFTGGLADAWTTRLCNDTIDVVHFAVGVVVETDQVMNFISELCSEKKHVWRGYKGDEPEKQFVHNQITVMGIQSYAADRESEAHRLYRYGKKPVVELTCVCEYVFVRAGYDKIKPDAVKSSLNQPVETPTAETATENTGI